MRHLILRNWLRLALLFLAIAAILFAISFHFSTAYQICSPGEYTHQKECTQYHLGPYILAWIVAVIDIHNGLVTAIATVFIAGFTTVLATVTNRQARLTRESIDLARKEYVTSHRPRIILRDVFLVAETINYMLVNTGDTDATIVESWIFGEFIEQGTRFRVPRSAGHNDLGELVFSGGESKDLTCDLPPSLSFAMKFPDSRRIGIDGQEPVFGNEYFVGVIVYVDDVGVRRRSVFRRHWHDGRERFMRLKPEEESDNEYAD